MWHRDDNAYYSDLHEPKQKAFMEDQVDFWKHYKISNDFYDQPAGHREMQQELLSALKDGRPIWLSYRIGEAPIDAAPGVLDTNLQYKDYVANPRKFERHAVVIVGAKLDANGDTIALKFLNSYGRSWGRQGFGILSYRFFEAASENMFFYQKLNSPQLQ